jgi:hypothetical protein
VAEPHQMLLVQGNKMIQHFAKNAGHPPFRDAVLLRTPNADSHWLHTAGLQKTSHIAGELTVAVEHDVAVWTRQRKGPPQLLYDSFPIVLTTENDLPRPFQIGTFPAYVVIDRDDNVAGAVEGDQGFGELRKLLKKSDSRWIIFRIQRERSRRTAPAR